MGEVMGKTRRNRVVAVLGAGGVLATVLTGVGAAALAQPASARAVNPQPKLCVAIEALVGDGVSGSGLGGEVLTVNSGVQGTLTTNSSPTGGPDLDAPSDMAFLPGGNIVVTDEGFTGFVPDVVEVDKNTGSRTLISGGGRGSGPVLETPQSVAVEASGDILVANETFTSTELLRIDPA